MNRLPTVFISHGSPMHALDPGGAGRAWQAIAAGLPRPRAVLVVSAHWETSLPMLTGRGRHDTIHDFSGFQAPLYELRYDAPGAPDLGLSTPRPCCAPRAALRPWTAAAAERVYSSVEGAALSMDAYRFN
jgi:aromatic ring-opening dioxygenase catalytic subunit (LigB family)